MITKLEAFLTERARKYEAVEFCINNEFSFKLRAIKFGEWNELRKRAIDSDGRVDSTELSRQVIIAGCIEPNFKGEEFVQSAGCITPSELIDKLLNAGEVSKLSQKILDISGFGETVEDVRDEAKN